MGNVSLEAAVTSLRASFSSFTARHEVRTTTRASGPAAPDRHRALVTLSHEALSRQGRSASPGGIDLGLGTVQDLINRSALDQDQRTTLLLLAMLLRNEDPEKFQAFVEDLQRSEDLAADYQAIVHRAAGLEQGMQAALDRAQARQAEAQAETVRQDLSARHTLGAVVEVQSETRLRVVLLDETTVEVDVAPGTDRAEALRLMQTSVTVGEFVAKVSGTVVVQMDPLVLDLNGDGISRGERSFAFDLDGDGRGDRVESLGADDALLALDRDGDGRIGNGLELFGEHHGAADGFEELRRYDQNQDGVIDDRDTVFSDLVLLHDKNGDGTVSPDEITALADAGVQRITLPHPLPRFTGQERTATYSRHGVQHQVADLFLSFERTA